MTTVQTTPTTKKVRNQKASFWLYTGNHHNGSDCERKDPHGFGLDVIAYLDYCDRSGDYQKPLTFADIKSVKVSRAKNDSFGQECVVSATKEVWERAKQALLSI
jgi:hypothetical protein